MGLQFSAKARGYSTVLRGAKTRVDGDCSVEEHISTLEARIRNN